jgi:hypothetical protein
MVMEALKRLEKGAESLWGTVGTRFRVVEFTFFEILRQREQVQSATNNCCQNGDVSDYKTQLDLLSRSSA